MRKHMHVSEEKTKVTFECSPEEKIYIKMLAAKSCMTLGDFILSYLKIDFPKKKRKANKETLEAIKELREGTLYESMEDFWADMGVKPSG